MDKRFNVGDRVKHKYWNWDREVIYSDEDYFILEKGGGIKYYWKTFRDEEWILVMATNKKKLVEETKPEYWVVFSHGEMSPQKYKSLEEAQKSVALEDLEYAILLEVHRVWRFETRLIEEKKPT